jgi:TonB family protein
MLSELVNHVWQSTLVAVAIAALAVLLRDDSAHSRYWLWWAASLKFFVPFSLLAALGGALRDAGAPRIELADWPSTLGVLAEPMPEAAGWAPLRTALLVIWAGGFACVVGAWIVRAFKVRALLRASAPYAGALPRGAGRLEARMSSALLEPALVGIVRPVLLLPQGITEHLTRTQLDAVLEHELTHWRRRDNLTAAMHMVVEAVFWFHPLVWWIGARLVEERERACDEAVVRAGHDGRTYAEAILNVCERYVASALKCAAGISGADLKRRVVEIARNRVMSELTIQKKILVAAFALATTIVPIVFGAAAQDAAPNPIPILRINPNYPKDALTAGREGSVDLEFTIAANGSVKDVVVVSSTAPEFEAPSVAALLRWRFLQTNVTCVGIDCRTIETVLPVERPGMRTVINYRLNGAEARPEDD